LETLPGQMERQAADLAKLEAEFADPGLYGRDPDRFAKLAAAIDAARGQLAAGEEEWLRLEMLREELEG
ncbi:hypothetical protein J8J27_25125, partial [Mycobacterium tuberculosis]|nr:hypothetical protein [Mycobacterium tuberculosis]